MEFKTTIEDFRLSDFLSVSLLGTKTDFMVECDVEITNSFKIESINQVYVLDVSKHNNCITDWKNAVCLDFDDSFHCFFRDIIKNAIKQDVKFRETAKDAIAQCLEE